MWFPSGRASGRKKTLLHYSSLTILEKECYRVEVQSNRRKTTIIGKQVYTPMIIYIYTIGILWVGGCGGLSVSEQILVHNHHQLFIVRFPIGKSIPIIICITRPAHLFRYGQLWYVPVHILTRFFQNLSIDCKQFYSLTILVWKVYYLDIKNKSHGTDGIHHHHWVSYPMT